MQPRARAPAPSTPQAARTSQPQRLLTASRASRCRSDALVQNATGMSVAEIFAAEGEEAFRDVEAAVLNEVASYGRVVVSTGGGVVMRRTNWGHLRNGVVLYLDAPVECVPRAAGGPPALPGQQQQALCCERQRALTRAPLRQGAGGARGCGGRGGAAAAGGRAQGRREGARHGAPRAARTATRCSHPHARPPARSSAPQRVLQEMLDTRGEMYRQADVTVPAAAEGEAPAATAERALAGVDALLLADDTRERLRRVPDANSVTLRGSRGPSQI